MKGLKSYKFRYVAIKSIYITEKNHYISDFVTFEGYSSGCQGYNPQKFVVYESLCRYLTNF